MRTLVDTCVLSEIQRAGGEPLVREAFVAIPPDDIFLSVLTVGELRKGVDKLRASHRKRSLATWLDQVIMAAGHRVLPIDLETATIWGEISARLEGKGRRIPAIDGLIAATAIRHGLHLMTRNVTDFEPTGVLLVNPWGS